MKYLLLKVLIVTLSLFYKTSGALTGDEVLARLECVQYCHSKFKRSCSEAPNVCGKCMGALVDVAGSCVTEEQVMEHPQMLGVKKSMTSGDIMNTGSYSMSRIGDQVNIQYWDVIVVAILCSVSVILLAAMVLTVVCVCRVRNRKDIKDTPYQTYYGTNPPKDASHPGLNGDRKLAYSAQMYHYQYQKQQMLQNEKANAFEHKSGNSTDDEAGADDDDTVYECPGLANTEGEMEVSNPYFVDTPPEKQP